ncbi:MAG TPA: OsmC family protein [bacterium]|nr:OsmC family protein [bacterium]
MEITAKFVGQRTFLARGDSRHWVAIDTREQVGGSNSASSPMELVLMGLASCTGLDVVAILEKRRVTLTDYEIRVSAERAEDHPRVYTDIHLKFIFTSQDLTDKDAERAIHLSETKYCSVTAMLEKTAEITTEFEILRPE